METLLQDVRYGIRILAHNRGVTIVAVLAMTLGISANTTMFSATDATLFRPLSFPTLNRLVMIWESNVELGYKRGSVSPANQYDWREQNQTFEQIIPISQSYFDLTERDDPERIFGYWVGAGFFDALGATAQLGRTFTREEDKPGSESVLVLKHSLWQRRFGADPGIVGQKLRLNDKNFTVIGVMPPDFNYPFNGGELWTPMSIDQRAANNRASHFLSVMGLMKPGITIAQAKDDLSAIAARAAAQFPETNAGLGVNVLSLTEDATRGSRMYAPIMLMTVGLVLLIACANVANLLLVRGASRRKEIAIRLAMGASRWRLIRQLLTESVLLSLIGGALGLLVSVWGMKALAQSIPEDFSKFIPGWHNLRINQTAFAFTLVVSIFTGLLSGLVPAIQTSRSKFNEVLKDGGKGSSGKAARNRARSALVVAEIGLSLTLLIGAGLLVRSFVTMLNSNFGVNAANVLTMQASLQSEKYATRDARVDNYGMILSRISALPNVMYAGAIGNLPMGGSNNSHNMERIGDTVFAQAKRPQVNYAPITPGYLSAMGTRLIRGRQFSDQDRKDSARVALVNESFVNQFLNNQEPLGQTYKEAGGTFEIVGVVEDVMNEDFDEQRYPQIYVPYSQDPWYSMSLVIRSDSAPANIASAVRAEIASIDRTIPIFNLKPMDRLIAERMSPRRLITVMMLVFSLLALLLASVGMYAVMSYAVSQRTYEIGIRMAVGASSADIFRLVISQGVGLTLIGIIVGLGGAYALSGAVSGLLYGIAAKDPATYIGLSALLTAVSLIACYVPTRKATRLDPMIALREYSD